MLEIRGPCGAMPPAGESQLPCLLTPHSLDENIESIICPLSKNDEWTDFEIMPFKLATQSVSKIKGSYVRDALLEGIKREKTEGFNPYKFGFIGSSDTHTAASSVEEDNFFSKVFSQGILFIPL